MTEKDGLITITSAMVFMTFPEEVDGIYQLTMMIKGKLSKKMDEIGIDYDEKETENILFECLPKIMELLIYRKKESHITNCS